MGNLIRGVRDAGRLREIATILVRHGLGDAARRLGLVRLLEGAARILHRDAPRGVAHLGAAERFRSALEEMGPTFVKLGQLLAGRRDLLPEEWCVELERLHQNASTVPFEEIRAQVEEDLGGAVDEIFERLDPKPLAAASIAQVHRARTHAGCEVVLKVRRPGIVARVEADLRLAALLAELLEENFAELRSLRPRQLVSQLSRSLRAEMDLRSEARNAERMRAALGSDAQLVIPRFYAEWTHERLTVIDFLEGPALATWLGSKDFSKEEGARIALAGANETLRMIFVDGFFHADPHPGNVLLLEGGALGLVDFGMVGRLSEERRVELLGVLLAAGQLDAERLADALLGWCPGTVNRTLLSEDCMFLLERYGELELEELDIAELLFDVHALLRRNGLFLPEDLAVLLKALVTLDDLGRRLDPHFKLATCAARFAREALRREHSPRRVLRRSLRALRRLGAAFPRDIERLAGAARRGKLNVEVNVEHLETFSAQLSRSANRVTVGLVTSALIVGTSIALTVTEGRTAFGLPLFAMLGFVTSLVAGGWLLLAVWRSGR